MTGKKSAGKIFTFYSYKGGTGRSMMLANVAWILASNGKKVLAIDWDLEAPGLHRYFYPFLSDKNLTSSDGVINFVTDYKLKVMTPPAEGVTVPADWYVEYANIKEYASTLNWDFGNGGRLDFVPAGRQDESYPSNVTLFGWQDFYERLGGKRFLEEVKQSMKQDYDYTLIDSRTGVSDTSGICTVIMPDALVVCFTLNYQSINGASTVANTVLAQRRVLDANDEQSKKGGSASDQSDKPPFNIFPVPMRLENAEKKKLEARRDYARQQFAQFPISLRKMTREQYWQSVPVLYDTFYAYEELLAAFGEKERDVTSLLAAAERLTTALTDSDITQLPTLPQPKRDEILAKFEDRRTKFEITDELSKVADTAFALLLVEQQNVARRVLLRLVRVARPEEVDGRNSRQRARLEEFDTAAQQVIGILTDAQLLETTEDDSSKESYVQIAHDALIQEWKSLKEWIAKDRNFLLWRQDLRPVVEKWQHDKLDERVLLRGAPLSLANDYYLQSKRNPEIDFSTAEQEFVYASILQQRAREQQEQARKEEASALERAREERERLERERGDGVPVPQYQQSVGQKIVDLLRNLLWPPKAIAPKVEDVAASHVTESVALAGDVLRGQTLDPETILKLANKLKEEKAFGYARRILARARAHSDTDKDKKLRLKIYQQSALCTYKDQDLPADTRLDLALEILGKVEDFAHTTDQETLGLLGAVYKRKWEIDNQREQLERALFYYQRGYQQGPENDQGYTGINAAYVLDLLAHQEEEEAREANATSESAARRRFEAQSIRQDIVEKVSPLVSRPDHEWLANKWWYYSTVAEAHFGLGHYNTSVEWLNKGKEVSEKVFEWEYETTTRQFASLARLQADTTNSEDFEDTPAWEALKRFFGDEIAPVRSIFTGKIGLGLSGGGFRASLYHIGVMARLAELDVLRRVEVLSCVSGGSIIGAHYYLEVRKLLQSKADKEVRRQDYIDIVARMQKDFLAGVQRNIRTRVAAEFLTNVRMIFGWNYSRTMRAGELYEREIFSRVRDGGEHEARWLGGLLIKPAGDSGDFAPKRDNWRREAKVPILILNATTLNTGHNWQFTAAWMGEPPAGIDSEIDGNDRLRRMYYEEAPEGHRNVRLGHAVAASACVPGLFEPLVLDGLYPERTVRLVDGGVCDNQGVGGLLEQDCTVLLVSDGSGQMESQKQPSNNLIAVPLRSLSILQARVREAEFHELSARRRASLLRGLLFVHLKEDLDVDPVDWIDCIDPYDASDDARPAARRGTLTSYGVAKDIQQCLASVRTDLDSFSDVEAYSLMTSGYRMTERQFSQRFDGFAQQKEPSQWDFLAVDKAMKGTGKSYRYLKELLGVSSNAAFKVWQLSRALRFAKWLLMLLTGALVVWLCWRWANAVIVKPLTVGAMGFALLTTILTSLATYIVGARIMRVVSWRDTLTRILIGLAMSTLGFLLARLHLHIFDCLFLRFGSLDRFKQQTD